MVLAGPYARSRKIASSSSSTRPACGGLIRKADQGNACQTVPSQGDASRVSTACGLTPPVLAVYDFTVKTCWGTWFSSTPAEHPLAPSQADCVHSCDKQSSVLKKDHIAYLFCMAPRFPMLFIRSANRYAWLFALFRFLLSLVVFVDQYAGHSA